MADPFRFAVLPRYVEVDQQGVVFNMWYLAYFDEAMTAYLEHAGTSYQDLLGSGHDVQLVHTELDWSGPLRYGDRAEITVRTHAVGRTSFTLEFDVGSGAGPVCRARTVYVVVAPDGSGKLAVPPSLRAGLEHGRPEPGELPSV